MPYSGPDDKKLPDRVKKMPKDVREAWVKVFNSVYKKEGEKMAFMVANKRALKLLKSRKKEPLKRNLEVLQFAVAPGQLIRRSDDGEEYVSLVLAGSTPHKDGRHYTEETLQKWASYINDGNVLSADVDHAFYDMLVNQNYSDEQIKNMLRAKPKSIAKSIKAIYEKGKLYLRAVIDKRYRRLIQQAKGVSLEALVNYADDGKTIVGGDILGFTFNVNTEPADASAALV